MNDLYISIENSIPGIIPGLNTDELENVCLTVLAREKINSADINIVIVGDTEITALKKEYFNIDQTTDVISFNLTEEDSGTSCLEAEIIVNAEMALRESKISNFPPQSELILYIVHGLLHQLGYDDQSEEDYYRMHNRENELLDELGYGKVFGCPEWNDNN